MSLHQLANHMSAQGRGPDSTLVHMSPREVSGLQSLAMANGGTLTINPQTGLPEAGFLDSILPTLLGGAATFFSGGTITPFMAALGVGGLTALTSKDLGKGLMAGLGAYGGGSIVSGLAGFGAADIGEKAIGAATADATAAGLENTGEMMDAAGNLTRGSDAYAAALQKGVGDRMAGASYYDKLAAGASKAMTNPGDALSAFGGGNTFMGAAKLAMPVMAAFSAVDEPKTSIPEKSKTAYIRSFYKDPVTGQKMANPAIPAEDFGNRTLGEQHYAANGGLIALAGGGQTAYDYLDRKRSTSSDAGIVVDDTPPKPRLPPLGSDGKGSYTYNKDSKTWVWTPTTKPVVPVNSGVATLMDIGGPGGNEITPPSPFTPVTDNGFFSNLLGRTTQPAAPVVTKDMYQPSAIAEQAAKDAANNATTARGIATLGVDPSTLLAPGELAGSSQMTAKETQADQAGRIADAKEARDIENAQRDAQQIQAAQAQQAQAKNNQRAEAYRMDAQAEQDAAFQGLANREAANAAKDLASAFSPSRMDIDAIAAAKMTTENALIDAAQKEAADKAAVFSAALAEANAAQAQAAQAAQDATAFAGAQQAQEAQAQANREASTSTAPAPAPDTAPSGSSDFGSFSGGFDSSGTQSGGDYAHGGMTGRYAQGGLGSLGGYSDGGRLLRGPGDGVSDSIPATVGDRQPARLADGEFVVPARIVSELGNGSTEAGARALYKMMDRIQANRRKTTGKNSVAVNSKSHKYLPA